MMKVTACEEGRKAVTLTEDMGVTWQRYAFGMINRKSGNCENQESSSPITSGGGRGKARGGGEVIADV